MEPVLVPDCAAAVATLCTNIVSAQSGNGMVTDMNIFGLKQELVEFLQTLQAFEQAWKKDSATLMEQFASDTILWASIKDNLESSRATLHRIETALGLKNTNYTNYGGWLPSNDFNRSGDALDSGSRSNEITIYRQSLRSHQIAMQGILQMVNLYLQVRGNVPHAVLESSFTNLKKHTEQIEMIVKRAREVAGIAEDDIVPSLDKFVGAAISFYLTATAAVEGRGWSSGPLTDQIVSDQDHQNQRSNVEHKIFHKMTGLSLNSVDMPNIEKTDGHQNFPARITGVTTPGAAPGNRPTDQKAGSDVSNLHESQKPDENRSLAVAENPVNRAFLSAVQTGRIDNVAQWLERGANLQTKDGEGQTALHIAVVNNSTDLAAYLISYGLDVNVQDTNQRTPLNAAAKHGKLESLKLLLDLGAGFEDPLHRHLETPLYLASVNGHVQTTKELLKRGARFTFHEALAEELLAAAAANGHDEICPLLLRSKWNVRARDHFLAREIYCDARDGNSRGLRKLLASSSKEDFSYRDKDGYTAMHTAVFHGQSEAIQLLSEHGASIYNVTDDGATPFYSAASEGHTQILQQLLDIGADVTEGAKNNWTPMHIAVENGHRDAVELLLAHGAPVNPVLQDGKTPVWSAARYGRLEILELLVAHGGEVNVTPEDKWTPLHAAAGEGYAAVVRLLLEKGARTDVANGEGQSPVWSAAAFGYVEVLELLLDRGADIDRKSPEGYTPLDAAAYHGHPEAAEFLRRRGAVGGTTTSPAAVAHGTAGGSSKMGRLFAKFKS